MRSIIRQKKGDISDMIIFIITVFILAIGLFVMIFIIPNITNGLRTANLNNTLEGTNAINYMDKIATDTIGNGFLMVFVGLIISVMITSFMVRTHPIFMFLYIFFLAITILLGFYLGNAYEQMIANPIFSNILHDGRFITLVMSHIAEITLAVGALSIIIVFAKFSTYGGTQQF